MKIELTFTDGTFSGDNALRTVSILFESSEDAKTFLSSPLFNTKQFIDDEIDVKMNGDKVIITSIYHNVSLDAHTADILNALSDYANTIDFKKLSLLIESLNQFRNKIHDNIAVKDLKAMELLLENINKFYLQHINSLGETSKTIFKDYHNNLASYSMKVIANINIKIREQQKHNNYIQSENKLKFLIDNSIPVNPNYLDSLLLNLDTSFYRYIIKQPSEHLPNEIKRLALYMRKPDTNDAANNSVIDITYRDNHKIFATPASGMLNLADCSRLFIEHDAILDLANARRNTQPLDTEEWENLSLYKQDQSIEPDYANIHKEITSSVISFIQNIEQPIEILFIGCGEGNEIVAIQDYLEKNNVAHIIYGVDRDQKNIENARNKFIGKNVHFECGDAQNIDEHLQKLRVNAQINNIIPKTTITISSGFLTREVVTPKNAFEIFQKVASHSDNIFISGRTETLINRRDAKKCGMSIEHHSFKSGDDPRTLDHYSYITLDKQAAQIVSALKKQNEGNKIIELAEHARPIQLIKHLQQHYPDIFKSDVVISLKNAYISEKDFPSLASLIKENEGKVSILTSGSELWHKSFLNFIQLNKAGQDIASHVHTHTYKPNLFETSQERPKISEGLKERVEKTIITKKI